MYFIDFIFLLDMILTFFTTITDKNSMLELTDKKAIAKDYIRTWFIIDLVSIFPFDEISALFQSGIECGEG